MGWRQQAAPFRAGCSSSGGLRTARLPASHVNQAQTGRDGIFALGRPRQPDALAPPHLHEAGRRWEGRPTAAAATSASSHDGCCSGRRNRRRMARTGTRRAVTLQSSSRLCALTLDAGALPPHEATSGQNGCIGPGSPREGPDPLALYSRGRSSQSRASRWPVGPGPGSATQAFPDAP